VSDKNTDYSYFLTAYFNIGLFWLLIVAGVTNSTQSIRRWKLENGEFLVRRRLAYL